VAAVRWKKTVNICVEKHVFDAILRIQKIFADFQSKFLAVGSWTGVEIFLWGIIASKISISTQFWEYRKIQVFLNQFSRRRELFWKRNICMGDNCVENMYFDAIKCTLYTHLIRNLRRIFDAICEHLRRIFDANRFSFPRIF
jgi:hypothetical protein